MRKYALTVALICFVTVLSPVALQPHQPVVISGKVTDTQGRPIPTAVITVPVLNASTVSDTGGVYDLVKKYFFEDCLISCGGAEFPDPLRGAV
jgi:hypothetical protein